MCHAPLLIGVEGEALNIRFLQMTRERVTLSVSMGVEDVKVRDVLQGVSTSIAGAGQGPGIGGPDLPQITFEVALPPGTAAGKVEVVRKSEHVVLRERTFPRPVQPPAPGSCRHPDPRLRNDGLVVAWPAPQPVPPDPELYQRAYTKAPPTAETLSTDHQGPNGIARLAVRPVSLRDDGALVLDPHIEVTVHLVPLKEDLKVNSRQVQFYSRQQAVRWTELAKSRVINASDVDLIGAHIGFLAHADYLIITSNRRWDETSIASTGDIIGDAVAEFERLSDWKRKKGLSARVVTVDDIVAGRYGTFTGACRRDLQEVLREFIKWAYREWGVAWLLLGGDADIIPVRKVVGYVGGIVPGTKNPPDDGGSFWAGSTLRLHSTASIDDLIRTSDGHRLRYSIDGTGSTPRWSYTTSETYATISSMPTQYVRVDGSAGDLQSEELFILNNDNAIPTDLYYSTVAGYVATGATPLYFCDARTGALGSRCSTRDWDWQNNGLYGQYNSDGDLGGQTYTADISVGRAPISSANEAKAFVDKVIGYENGGLFSASWTRKLLLVSSNWGGRIGVGPSAALMDNTYLHGAGSTHTVIQLAAAPSGQQTKLMSVAADGSEVTLQFRVDAAPGRPGWTYIRSGTDLTSSVIDIPVPWGLVEIPIPSRWIAIYGGNLAPAAFVVDDAVADGSMTDQEQLRHQLAATVPGWSSVDRVYEDDADLAPTDAAAAPLTHLTQPTLEMRLNAGQHIVSLSGHGNWPGCCGLDPGVNSRLTNAAAPFIGYADSCLTNEFDLTFAISEDLVNNSHGGAVAYIGNSRFSWIGVGDDFQRNFFAGLAATTALGLLNDRRCAGVHLLPGYERYNRWSIFSLNLMGDPEMRVRVRSLNFPCIELSMAARLDRPYIVKVSQNSNPVTKAVVTAASGEWHTQASTGYDGSAALDLTGAPMGDLSITVTHPELVPATEVTRTIGPVWREAEVLRVDAGQTGVQVLVRWDGAERVLQLSPCVTAPLASVLTTAIARARPVRLYIVEEPYGSVVEAASMLH
jgi:hypothetical protein